MPFLIGRPFQTSSSDSWFFFANSAMELNFAGQQPLILQFVRLTTIQ